MAIDPTDLVKIDGLVISTTIDFDKYIPQAKGGLVPEALKLETLLRTRAYQVIDATALAAKSIVFDTYTVAVVTIDQSCQLELTLKANETCYIYVTKAASNEVTFKYYNAIDSMQIGETALIYKAVKVNNVMTIKRIDNQFSTELIIADLDITDATITDVDHYRFDINNNICVFSAYLKVVFDAGITGSDINIGYSGSSPIDMFDTTDILNGYVIAGGVVQQRNVIYVLSDTISIDLTGTLIAGVEYSIRLNGSFRIK